MRLKLGLTQKKLAEIIGISTSMMNQIESGRSQPSYENAKKIFDDLATLEGRSSSCKVGDFCSKIITLHSNNNLHDATKKMHEFSISQIPIFNDKKPIGLVTEDGIIRYLSLNKETNLKKVKIYETMESVPPIIDYNTPTNTVIPLIRFSKCILVSKNSSIIGIITISDTLKMIDQ